MKIISFWFELEFKVELTIGQHWLSEAMMVYDLLMHIYAGLNVNWQWANVTIARVPVKQPHRVWIKSVGAYQNTKKLQHMKL